MGWLVLTAKAFPAPTACAKRRRTWLQVIVVPKDFDVHEGVKLSKQYTVGKELAGGSQGAIFELQDGDGQDLPKLLKVCIAHTLPLRGNPQTL